RVVGWGLDEPGLHVSGSSKQRNLGSEVEVLIGDVEGYDATRRKMSLIQRHRFASEQMHRDRVAGKGVDSKHIEALRGFLRKRNARVTLRDTYLCGRVAQEGKEVLGYG